MDDSLLLFNLNLAPNLGAQLPADPREATRCAKHAVGSASPQRRGPHRVGKLNPCEGGCVRREARHCNAGVCAP